MYVYYCKYCGEIMYECEKICPNCHTAMLDTQSKHEKEYYEQKSIRLFGSDSYWSSILIKEEVMGNPLYDVSKVSITTAFQLEVYEEQLQAIEDAKKNPNKGLSDIPAYNSYCTKNTPKCPTCGSTNVKKISDLNRIASVALFGLASSKIGKQFQCKKCGYKW